MDHIKRVFEAKRAAEATHELLKDAPRGSFNWWALKARQYTGSCWTDSGGYYGYGYQAPPAVESAYPIMMTCFDGRPEYATVSTEHYLRELLDVDTNRARGFELLLNDFDGSYSEFLNRYMLYICFLTETSCVNLRLKQFFCL